MTPPRERPRPARRRIAGERARQTGPAPVEQDTAAQRIPAEEIPAESSEAPAEPAETTPAETTPAETTAAPAAAPTAGGAGGRFVLLRTAPPRWVLAVVAGLLVVALALDAFVVWRELSHRQAREDAERALHSATIQAPSVAEKAAESVLSFRHDTVQKDIAEARRFLSEEYAPSYISSIRDVVSDPASDIQAQVKAEVLASGVVEASGQRSDVLLFVDQTTTSSAKAEPTTALNRVVFTMVRRDGGWVVHEIKAF